MGILGVEDKRGKEEDVFSKALYPRKEGESR
jgi:hypothetical protein